LSFSIHPTVSPVGERQYQKKLNIRTFEGVYFAYMERRTFCTDWAQFLAIDVRDIITPFKFGDDRLRGLGSAEGQSSPFPIDFDGRPYNTVTQYSACVIRHVGL